jgi:hypothetical protein
MVSRSYPKLEVPASSFPDSQHAKWRVYFIALVGKVANREIKTKVVQIIVSSGEHPNREAVEVSV